MPHSLLVLPDGMLVMDNGDPQEFDVEVHDISGNLATQSKLQVVCKVRCKEEIRRENMRFQISHRISLHV